MKSSSILSRFAVQSLTSILGSVGQGTATESPNFILHTNSGGIGASPEIDFTAPPFTARTTGKVFVAGMMGVTSQAAADEVEFILTKDSGGLVANMFTNGVAGAGLPFCGATLFYVDQVTVGTPHTYGISAVLIQPGGHTVAVVGSGQVVVLVYELP